jgi:hypothetical protein
MDPYETLGIAKDASRWDVEKAKNTLEAAGSKGAQIPDDYKLAYFILLSADRRQRYDSADEKDQCVRLMDTEYRKEQAYQAALVYLSSGINASKIVSLLKDYGLSENELNEIIQSIQTKRKGISRNNRKAALKQIGIAVAFIVGGVVLTLVTKILAEALDFPIYLVFSGLVIYGIVRLIRALLAFFGGADE